MSQTAAVQRFCDAHLERAGVSVPATRFVGTQAFCSSCFNGRPVRAAQQSSHTASQKGLRIAVRPAPAIETQAAEQRLRRRERIRVRRELAPQVGDPLRPREKQTLELLAGGLSNKEIAASLGITTRTAKGHVSGVLAKLGFSNRADIRVWYLKNGGDASKANSSNVPDHAIHSCLARIEQQLDRLCSIARERVCRLQLESRLAAEVDGHVTQFASAFKQLKESLGACPENTPSSPADSPRQTSSTALVRENSSA